MGASPGYLLACDWDASPDLREVTSAWAGMVGLGATPVCGMAVRGVSIALDDPGASSAGSGDWAFAGDVGSAAMLPASINDTIRVRIMGFPCWPL
jgi:hypothetical protein